MKTGVITVTNPVEGEAPTANTKDFLAAVKTNPKAALETLRLFLISQSNGKYADGIKILDELHRNATSTNPPTEIYELCLIKVAELPILINDILAKDSAVKKATMIAEHSRKLVADVRELRIEQDGEPGFLNIDQNLPSMEDLLDEFQECLKYLNVPSNILNSEEYNHNALNCIKFLPGRLSIEIRTIEHYLALLSDELRERNHRKNTSVFSSELVGALCSHVESHRHYSNESWKFFLEPFLNSLRERSHINGIASQDIASLVLTHLVLPGPSQIKQFFEVFHPDSCVGNAELQPLLKVITSNLVR